MVFFIFAFFTPYDIISLYLFSGTYTFPCSSAVEQSTVNRWVVGSNPTGGA